MSGYDLDGHRKPSFDFKPAKGPTNKLATQARRAWTVKPRLILTALEENVMSSRMMGKQEGGPDWNCPKCGENHDGLATMLKHWAVCSGNIPKLSKPSPAKETEQTPKKPRARKQSLESVSGRAVPCATFGKDVRQ
eukprot:c26057_g1_i1.p1 GENE.c26057_g1_i1~~c26057_g1_i1.p1  ORF type:complete len:150 (+),score=22.68 c26057_g1_i1:43-450(+)